MSDTQNTLYDVVIAGAGPVGLFLACELRLAGSSVLVLEAEEDPASPVKQLPFGMRGLSTPTLDALYRRGFLEELTVALGEKFSGSAAPGLAALQKRQPAGHFAGIQFYDDDVDTSKWSWRLPTAAGTGLAGETAALETILAARAIALGVHILRDKAVEAIDSSDDQITIHAARETFRGRWLVGCDGGRSIVRKQAGFSFVGTDPEFTGYSIGAKLTDPAVLRPGRHYTPTGMYAYSPTGMITMVDFDGGAFHRAKEISLGHLQSVLRRVTGVDIELQELQLATTWTDRAYQATTYRNGRILLAGDAAHIHSPLGGQGLNLGIGDAMNLGWKLAFTIRGIAPSGLLDSYTTERHPIGAQVLDWSRAQVAIMRPTPSSRAIEAILRDLMATRDGATYFAERVSGVSIKYDLGGGHPLIGASVPDFELMDGTKIGTLLRSGKGLVLDFESRPSLARLAARWPKSLIYVGQGATDSLGLRALLVRPDGIVAWIGEAAFDDAEVAQAASRWFGA
ncbi:FAD-dependent monooxygenase [Burkholderia cenocepacia]|uniref:FAD-dependent monooxygenase n=1 Tax=Burkholderia cenocepacia TaxID=95486 RepID=UPI001B9C64D7|nr:FAD-dependent monooxygenase [Burkholderia cenocepacia]MBR8094960.1 FAD-dependent monooxygenase [Burkholderia cenocepacia]